MKKQPDKEKSQPCTSVFPMTMSEPGKACR